MREAMEAPPADAHSLPTPSRSISSTAEPADRRSVVRHCQTAFSVAEGMRRSVQRRSIERRPSESPMGLPRSCSLQSDFEYTPGGGKYSRLDSIRLAEEASMTLARSGVDKLHEAHEDERLDACNVRRAQDVLECILESGKLPTGCIEDEYSHIMVFKNRPLARCRLLHFAVQTAAMLDDGSVVGQVLSMKADVHSKAMYVTKKPNCSFETKLEAVHIAAGLGNVAVLQALLDHVVGTAGEDGASYLARHALVREEGELHWAKFYTPMHDAVYLGHKDAMIWLLEHEASAMLPNKDGNTPLHFVAFIGGRASLKQEQDVEEVVTALLVHRADLERRSYGPVQPYPSEPFLQFKTPLEIAADTQYPKNLLWLLAPSSRNENETTSSARFFADIILISRRNMRVAETFAEQMRERVLRYEESKMREMIWRETQIPGQVDRLAAILYRVPMAAAHILDLMTVSPEIQDVGKHPIPSRTRLSSGPMRCIYHTDITRIGKVRWPQWKFDARNWSRAAWHSKLVPRYHNDVGRNDCYDVDVKVVLVPNLLDVDILMALARTWESHNKIFSKLPIQGIVYCLWDGLVWRVFVLSWILMGLELVVLVWWGVRLQVTIIELPPGSIIAALPLTNSPKHAPLCMCILLTGAIREGIELCWWLLAHWSKWYGHKGDPELRSLWSLHAQLTDSWFISSVACLLLRFGLLWIVLWGDPAENAAMSEFEQAMLAINAFIQGFRVTYMLRLIHRFKRILVIFKTFFSRTIGEMLLIVVMIFTSFSLAFLMLIRSRRATWVATYLYRGLIFGDGDGLDKMGLRQEDASGDHPLLLLFMLMGTILFNITLLNLIIAIYGNEYDDIEKETDLHFLKERVKYCLVYIEMLHKQRLLDMFSQLEAASEGGFLASRFLPLVDATAMQVARCVGDSAAYSAQALRHFKPGWFRWAAACGCALAVVAAWASAWKFICDVFSVFPVLCSFFLAVSQQLVQAALIQADWFQPDAPEVTPGADVRLIETGVRGTAIWREGDGRWLVRTTREAGKARDATEAPQEEVWVPDSALELAVPAGFLWICHRSDYDEGCFFDPGTATAQDLRATNAKIDRWGQVITQMGSAIARMEAMMEDPMGLQSEAV